MSDHTDLHRQLVEAADALARTTAEIAALTRRFPADAPARVLKSGTRGMLSYLAGLDDVVIALKKLAVPDPPAVAPGTAIH